MQVIITAVGPDNVRLADPIIHHVSAKGANIAEIQMYDHDEEALFAMLLRIEFPENEVDSLRDELQQIGSLKNLSIRVWAPPVTSRPRLAICTTYRPETSLALLRAIRDGQIKAIPAVMMGNRNSCRGIAEQFGVPWHSVADKDGEPDNEKMVGLFDQYDVDYVVLARYMRVLPATTCWKFAGGRIINLHHGLLPGFPGFRPYHDAHSGRMLTYGATCHFIVPALDAGNQTIYQSTFQVMPGTKLDEIIRIGQEDNEPHCLVEGVRRAVNRDVQLHFHRVVGTGSDQ
jgi:formyltetrahydrofolate deformylase